MHKINIAIDGPAGSGKSTVAKETAAHLSYLYIDTGAMYRSLTFRALQANISEQDEDSLLRLLTDMDITLKHGEKEAQVQVFVNGQLLGEEIRSQAVTGKVSEVSAHGKIREEMVARQQKIAEQKGVVLDGRDIGTFVLPGAELKIYLYASVDERTKRRHLENIANGRPSDILATREELQRRDHLDRERSIAPLKQAKDAVPIDTTDLTSEEVVARICRIAREKETEGS
ncbi:(d)CMP kinase [Natribacillus halophilus]|uniref:Cytidylate kinase n=1 Tax=Natribacillus halophilus TaxID=549003 RepID=A0A1G8JDQ6_9BACI|nr:(d)CMP kinase [Natribacillus halophilus]SDI29335.1 cytidylate kinase [Natribacillus halophilus]